MQQLSAVPDGDGSDETPHSGQCGFGLLAPAIPMIGQYHAIHAGLDQDDGDPQAPWPGLRRRRQRKSRTPQAKIKRL
jgi:hypothetical protein